MLEEVHVAAGGNEGQPPTNTRVFISYSRRDGAFAEQLRAALIAAGFEAYLDREDILRTAELKRRW